MLGWKEIPAVSIGLDELQAELAEIDENLVRRDLSVLERAEHLARRKELYEAIHPETKHGGDRKSETAKIKIRNPDLDSDSFVDDAAKKTGRGRTAIAEEIQIGKAIPQKVRDELRNTDVANKKTELLALAALPPPTQAAVAKRVTSGEAASVREAIRQTKREELPALREEQVAALGHEDDGLAVSSVAWFDEFRRTKIRRIHLEEVPPLDEPKPSAS